MTNSIANNLETIGFDNWFLSRVTPENLEQFHIARVVAVHKDSYIINNGETDIKAELVGKLIYSASSPTDYPATGDWVLANFYDEDTFAIINEVLPRKSLLKRKTPGKKIDFQLIAANIDVAFIVQSLNENFNLRRLERYLVMVNESNIQPIVLLSKSDLLSNEDIANKIDEIQKIMPHMHIVPFSNENESGLNQIKEIIQPGLTYCLLGSSGVGKTTLINNLIGQSTYKTKTVSKKESKGRHATTHRQLIKLDSGAMVVDTPGMRELGNFSVDTGIEGTFSEITALSAKCHFNNCTHVNEKGCAVLEAVEKGFLPAERYQNYIKMTKECSYNQMSYLDKRKKDKQFGKLIKSVMKHKKSQS
ncbi:MAG: ribosome small subunit-dependent GTPase A [Thermoplasmata archaeon M8B2D]|nr:MAG: ribosome small subunit-dependent GTPase A [Thermoplasmata archaeon M8B2D]